MAWVCGVLQILAAFLWQRELWPQGLGAVSQWSSVHCRRPAEELCYQSLYSWYTTQRCSLWSAVSQTSFLQRPQEKQSLCFLDHCSGVSGSCEVLWDVIAQTRDYWTFTPLCLHLLLGLRGVEKQAEHHLRFLTYTMKGQFITVGNQPNPCCHLQT